MEVTSVVWQSTILVFLYITNTHGQGQVLTENLLEPEFIPVERVERSHSQISAVAGFQPGGVVLPNIAAANPYISQPSFNQMSLPSLSEPFFYGHERRQFSLIKSLFDTVKNLGLFNLGLVEFTDTDRHSSLRQAADSLNAAWDSVFNYYRQITNLLNSLSNKLSQIPIIGILVRIVEKILAFVEYIPSQIIKTLRTIVKKIVDNKKQNVYPVEGLPYAYL